MNFFGRFSSLRLRWWPGFLQPAHHPGHCKQDACLGLWLGKLIHHPALQSRKSDKSNSWCKYQAQITILDSHAQIIQGLWLQTSNDHKPMLDAPRLDADGISALKVGCRLKEGDSISMGDLSQFGSCVSSTLELFSAYAQWTVGLDGSILDSITWPGFIQLSCIALATPVVAADGNIDCRWCSSGPN